MIHSPILHVFGTRVLYYMFMFCVAFESISPFIALRSTTYYWSKQIVFHFKQYSKHCCIGRLPRPLCTTVRLCPMTTFGHHHIVSYFSLKGAAAAFMIITQHGIAYYFLR